MSILHSQPDLAKVARALVVIDDSGALEDLRDEIRDLRRLFDQSKRDETYSHRIYAESLTSLLADITDLDEIDCRVAVDVVLKRSWPAIAVATILDFAGQIEDHKRRSA